MSYVTPAIKDALKNHVLEEVLPFGHGFLAYYMKEPGQGRMMSTLFIFGPEGIVIMGDLCPGGPKNQGSISDFNYGIGWFSGNLSENYLCSKFLTEEWQAEAALEWIGEHVKEIESGEEAGNVEAFLQIERDLRGGEMDESHFRDDLECAGYVCDDELPGYDYHRSTAGWLCALQQRFSELFSAKEESKGVNSRELAEKIWNDAVRPCYEGLGQDNDLEPEDREAMLQGIEGMLERHAGLEPDPVLEKARKENAE